MIIEITRSIRKDVERDLWVKAGGRCEFNGCNKLLYKSSLTQEPINIAQKAHIYSFSPEGPRGNCPLKGKDINSCENLMLMCHECHLVIDHDKSGVKYSAKQLQEWKVAHEKRIVIVTGINPELRSHVILFSSPIGKYVPNWDKADFFEAMFPSRYPADDQPIDLSIKTNEEDFSPETYATHIKQLEKDFNRKVKERIEDGSITHVSLFGLGTQPFLFVIGKLFGNIIPADIYQRHRIPEQTWGWPESTPQSITYQVIKPTTRYGKIALLFALSSQILDSEIAAALKTTQYDMWKITVSEPNVNLIQCRESLNDFYKIVGVVYDEIKCIYGSDAEIHLFPVMPNSCAIMAGRAAMPKANLPMLLYDKVEKETKKQFVYCTKI